MQISYSKTAIIFAGVFLAGAVQANPVNNLLGRVKIGMPQDEAMAILNKTASQDGLSCSETTHAGWPATFCLAHKHRQTYLGFKAIHKSYTFVHDKLHSVSLSLDWGGPADVDKERGKHNRAKNKVIDQLSRQLKGWESKRRIGNDYEWNNGDIAINTHARHISDMQFPGTGRNFFNVSVSPAQLLERAPEQKEPTWWDKLRALLN